MTSPHVFSPYGNPGKEGCVRCPYPEDHGIHTRPSDADEWERALRVKPGDILVDPSPGFESRAITGAVEQIRSVADVLASYGYSSPVAELRFIAAQVESGEHKS
jgi:hypothetical protein